MNGLQTHIKLREGDELYYRFEHCDKITYNYVKVVQVTEKRALIFDKIYGRYRRVRFESLFISPPKAVKAGEKMPTVNIEGLGEPITIIVSSTDAIEFLENYCKKYPNAEKSNLTLRRFISRHVVTKQIEQPKKVAKK